MIRLLNAYRASPTPANRHKLEAYLRRYPMSVCFATIDEIKFLRNEGFSV